MAQTSKYVMCGILVHLCGVLIMRVSHCRAVTASCDEINIKLMRVSRAAEIGLDRISYKLYYSAAWLVSVWSGCRRAKECRLCSGPFSCLICLLVSWLCNNVPDESVLRQAAPPTRLIAEKWTACSLHSGPAARQCSGAVAGL